MRTSRSSPTTSSRTRRTVRPTFVVVSSKAVLRRGGGVGEYITVTYTIGDDDYSQTIKTVQPESGQPFLLEKPFFELRIDEEGGPTPSTGCQSTTSTPVLAFPGIYAATRDGNALFADATSDADKDEVGELPARFSFKFSSTLADGAEEAVQTAVNAFLDKCVQDHSLTPMTTDPNGDQIFCPFGLTAEQDTAGDVVDRPVPRISRSMVTTPGSCSPRRRRG